MRRVLYQGQVYILSRELPSHLELVHTTTGELLQIPTTEQLQVLEPPQRFFLPGVTPFDQRPPGFVSELQERRQTWLKNHLAELASKKRKPRNPNGPSKAPKGKRASLVGDAIAQLLALQKKV